MADLVADPYAGQYLTAGDPYVAANGNGFEQVPGSYQQTLISEYGSNAPKVWAQEVNLRMLQSGQAIMTPHGVMSIDNVKFALVKAGYNGPQDASSLATAYTMLQSPPQPVPAPAQTAQASATLGKLGVSGGISGIPRPLIYAGLALVAYEMFFKRGHR